MSPANQLLEAILEDPADEASRLVLADWLEEQGDDGLARARLLRLQVEHDRLPGACDRGLPLLGEEHRELRRLDRQARRILKARPGLIGALGELNEGMLTGLPFRVLSAGPALAMFLAADLILWSHTIAAIGAGLGTVVGNLEVLIIALLAWLVLGERPSQSLMLAVRARALLDGRLAPSIDDVLDLAEPVLKHRMALTFQARAEGRTIPDVIRQLKTRIG